MSISFVWQFHSRREIAVGSLWLPWNIAMTDQDSISLQ